MLGMVFFETQCRTFAVALQTPLSFAITSYFKPKKFHYTGPADDRQPQWKTARTMITVITI